MKSSIKTLQDISSLHDLRTYTGAVRKSGKPDLPTTAILDLYMRRNQLKGRLKDVEKEMTKLLERATKTAVELRGIPGKRGNPIRGSEKKERLILGY